MDMATASCTHSPNSGWHCINNFLDSLVGNPSASFLHRSTYGGDSSWTSSMRCKNSFILVRTSLTGLRSGDDAGHGSDTIAWEAYATCVCRDVEGGASSSIKNIGSPVLTSGYRNKERDKDIVGLVDNIYLPPIFVPKKSMCFPSIRDIASHTSKRLNLRNKGIRQPS